MKRVKIIVNNKQVTRRYLGDKLIGLYYQLIKTYTKGTIIDLEEESKFFYVTAWYSGDSSEELEFYFERYVPKKITIGDVVIADGVVITRREPYTNSFKITFNNLESKKRMLDNLKEINEDLDFENMEIKIYGVEV